MRLIDADALEREGWNLVRTRQKDKQTMVYETKKIEDVPTADVRENVHGEWIIRKCALGHEYTECSNCNTVFDIETHNGTLEWIDLRGASFCPNCGCQIRGEKNDNR